MMLDKCSVVIDLYRALQSVIGDQGPNAKWKLCFFLNGMVIRVYLVIP